MGGGLKVVPQNQFWIPCLLGLISSSSFHRGFFLPHGNNKKNINILAIGAKGKVFFFGKNIKIVCREEAMRDVKMIRGEDEKKARKR